MQVHNPAGSDLRCPTCLLSFDKLQLHKEHYKSDFHRYNLKRKMVKLAPATFEQFKSKRVEAQPNQASQFKCNECGKKFGSVKTLDQHAQSKGHDPHAIVSQVSSPPKPKKAAYKKNNKVCLFCIEEAANFEQNIRHMQSAHSFFIPQLNYCTNQQGLIEYLQQKIEVGFMCITCENKNAKDFNSGEAVRKHMSDKGHTFMKTQEGFDEYVEYYDFSEQFKEIVESQKDRYVPGIEYTTLKVVAKQSETANSKQGENQQDWQDDDESQGDKEKKVTKQNGMEQQQWESASQNEEQIKEKEELEKKPKQNKKKMKIFHIMRPTPTSNGQLLLPNGKILGHRKYRYLYRQTYRSPFWLTQNIKALGYEFGSNALISRQKLIEVARNDKLLYNTKLKWDKGRLRNGMQNNKLQIYYRSRNSV